MRLATDLVYPPNAVLVETGQMVFARPQGSQIFSFGLVTDVVEKQGTGWAWVRYANGELSSTRALNLRTIK